jgi:hypothetical protein
MVVLGFLINLFAGCVAIKRKEFWGGRIAALGIVIWLVTVAALQVNILLPRQLAGSGQAGIVLTAAGHTANTTYVFFQ